MRRDSSSAREPPPVTGLLPAGDDARAVHTRRNALRRGALGVAASTGVAGCLVGRGPGPLLTDSFEGGLGDWETRGHVGPEADDFEWRIEPSAERARSGERSVAVFTEGDRDDGTAWLVRSVDPGDVDGFRVTVSAWSPSESFNVIRHLVAVLGPAAPGAEEDFPDPGRNTTNTPRAPVGGLREPLHRAAGWEEYAFEWRPRTVPAELHLAVGVSVVWEADVTHYLDDVGVDPL